MFNKHAFLIIAHNKFDQLQLLLDLLDDKRNDIYVHIDKKVRCFPHLYTKFAGLNILKNRIDVRWGDVSQIETEILLFETALRNGDYNCFHLISGVDLPIKSNDYIHNFINLHPNIEFVGFSPTTSKSLEKYVLKYHILTKHYKNNNLITKLIIPPLRILTESIINLFYKHRINIELKKGPNLVSITQDFCKYIVERKNNIIKYYQHTRCCDEIFLQTLLWNSPFKKNIYNKENEFEGCMRLIDWNRGWPYIWGQDIEYDKKLILSSNCFFARKFDIDKYPEIISYIKNKENHNE